MAPMGAECHRHGIAVDQPIGLVCPLIEHLTLFDAVSKKVYKGLRSTHHVEHTGNLGVVDTKKRAVTQVVP